MKKLLALLMLLAVPCYPQAFDAFPNAVIWTGDSGEEYIFFDGAMMNITGDLIQIGVRRDDDQDTGLLLDKVADDDVFRILAGSKEVVAFSAAQLDFTPNDLLSLRLVPSATAVNYWRMESSDTGLPIKFKAIGTDTDVDMLFEAQGLEGVFIIKAAVSSVFSAAAFQTSTTVTTFDQASAAFEHMMGRSISGIGIPGYQIIANTTGSADITGDYLTGGALGAARITVESDGTGDVSDALALHVINFGHFNSPPSLIDDSVGILLDVGTAFEDATQITGIHSNLFVGSFAGFTTVGDARHIFLEDPVNAGTLAHATGSGIHIAEQTSATDNCNILIGGTETTVCSTDSAIESISTRPSTFAGSLDATALTVSGTDVVQRGHANAYWDAAVDLTTISVTQTFTKVVGLTCGITLGFTCSATTDDITVDSGSDGAYTIQGCASISPAANNKDWLIGVAVDGTVEPGSKFFINGVSSSNGDSGCGSATIMNLSATEVVTLVISNESGIDNVTVNYGGLMITRL